MKATNEKEIEWTAYHLSSYDLRAISFLLSFSIFFSPPIGRLHFSFMSSVPLRRSARIAAQRARDGLPALPAVVGHARPRKVPLVDKSAPTRKLFDTTLFQKEKKDDGAGATSSTTTTPSDGPATAYAHFSLSLFRASSVTGSYAVCPASLGSILALLMEGAKGKTMEEICSLLAHGGPEATKAFFRNLASSVNAESDDGVIARLLNTVFIDKKCAIVDGYKQRIENVYKGLFASIDLTRGEESAKMVNEVIEKATNGLFKDVTKGDAFTASTALMLVNMTTFEGAWKKPFKAGLTFQETFHGLDKKDRLELFMWTQECSAPFSRTDDLTVVELQYTDASWSLYLLMPAGDYRDWLEKLTGKDITAAMQGVKSVQHEYKLKLPKFSLDVDVNFKQLLMDNGVNECFSPEADLSGMFEDRGGHVQSVQQKLLFAVAEEGTKAGAVTIAAISHGAGNTIYMNKPFLFILAKDQQPCFIGHVV